MNENLTPSNTSPKKHESVMDKITEEQLLLVAKKTKTPVEELRAFLSSISAEDGEYLSHKNL